MIAALLAAFVATVPTPILYLEGDDATFTGSTLSTWPARNGPNATVVTAPKKGDLANNHQAVRFLSQANGQQLSFGSVQATPSDYTVQIVWTTDASHGASGNRDYFLRSYVVIDTNDIIIPHIANLLTQYFTGYFDGAAGSDTSPGGGWHYFSRANWESVATKATPATILRVDTYVLTSGGCALYRNGVLQGTNAQYTQRAMTDLYMGGTKGSDGAADSTGFDGNVWQVKLWNSALAAADVVSEQKTAMCRFGASAWPPTIAGPSTIFGTDLVSWFDASDPSYVEYDTTLALSFVVDRTNLTDIGTGSGSPGYDPEAIHGRPAYSVGSTGVIGRLRDDSTAVQTYPSGTVGASQGVSMFAVWRNCLGAGQGSNDGPIAAFGAAAAANPRFDMSAIALNASPWVRSVQLQDTGASRSIVGTVDPSGIEHLSIVTQDEVADTATSETDGTIDTSGVANLGTTTLNTFAIGRRYSNGAFTGNGSTCVYIASLGVVKHTITSGERTSLRAWARRTYGVP